MAVIMDLGDEAQLHPRQKDQVGKQLALAAQKQVYGHRHV